MLNLKLGLAALAAEFASWGSFWWLGSTSDAALLSYLLSHALASALLALCLLPLVAGTIKDARQRLALMGLMSVICYAVPFVGFVAAIAAALILNGKRKGLIHRHFASLALPDFDPHQQAGASRRQTGLRSFLANAAVPVSSRMKAVVALKDVPGHIASPMLRMVLGDPRDDLRLLAYSMLDGKEHRISVEIQRELEALEQARRSEGSGSPGHQGLKAAWALSDLYWELIYQGVAQADVRDHALSQSLQYCEMVLAQRPDNALLMLRRGRLMHLLGRDEEALVCYDKALALGLPAGRVVPHKAELLFIQRKFAQVRELMRSLDAEHAMPRLRPCIRYWSTS
ncbi:tetratricopeptide repeat protein [Comamonas composti]|uniref:membrane protein n=1 Tax=Comamonas composti TaxID=408558 RepID=UPI0003F947F1|nr:membrane protein [Comamonas composti]